jgi:hypothetical protein
MFAVFRAAAFHAAAAIVLTAAPHAQAVDAAAGAWRGSLSYVRPDGGTAEINFGVNIAEREGALSGVAAADQIGLRTDLENVRSAPGRLRLDMRFGDGRARLAVRIRGDAMSGTLTTAGAARPVRLERVKRDVDPQALKDRRGLYDLENGEQLVLAPRPWYFDVYHLPSWQYRSYVPRSDAAFFAGPGAMLPAPALSSIDFAAAGADHDILYAPAAGRTLRGRRSPRVREEEISFASDGARIAGTLLRPTDARGPLPGVVVAWGSGRQDRYGFNGLVYLRAVWLAAQGFAVVIYDKRGVAASGGSYEAITDEALARDLAAAAEYLAARPEVDRRRVGVFAHSQSGIYAPRAIAMTDAIGFAVILSSTVVNAEIQEITRTEMQLAADGWPRTEINDAVATQILKFHYARRRIGWDAYVQSYHRVKDRPWFETVIGSTIDPERHSWDFWRQGGAFEPAEHWRRVAVPVLFLFGDADTVTPVDLSAAALANAFDGERRALLTVKIYDGAEHSLFRAKSGGVLEEASLTSLEAYLPDVLDWLATIGVAAR